MKTKRKKASARSNVNEKNLKALASFLILVLAFSILILFLENKETIVSTGMFDSLFTLTVVGMGFLIGLLFLISKPFSKGK